MVFVSCKNVWANIFFQKHYVIIQYSKNTYDKGDCKVFKLISSSDFCGLNVSKGRTIRKVIGSWGFLLHEFYFGQVRSSNCI